MTYSIEYVEVMADPGGQAVRLTSLAGGALSIITGLVVLLWPRKTLLLVAALLGVWLVLVGILRIVQAFTGKGHSRNSRILTGVSGLLYTVVGAVCLRDLFTTVNLLAVIVGLVWMVGGVAEIAWRKRHSVILGVFGIAAGVVVLVWPEISLTIMAIVAGAWLVVLGVVQLVLGLYRPTAAR
ncbi:MAG TPA: DUF308 domain-containing protein [Candidatus Limnocylindrales bacterium]